MLGRWWCDRELKECKMCEVCWGGGGVVGS